jgi:hypothetical protein
MRGGSSCRRKEFAFRAQLPIMQHFYSFFSLIFITIDFLSQKKSQKRCHLSNHQRKFAQIKKSSEVVVEMRHETRSEVSFKLKLFMYGNCAELVSFA